MVIFTRPGKQGDVLAVSCSTKSEKHGHLYQESKATPASYFYACAQWPRAYLDLAVIEQFRMQPVLTELMDRMAAVKS
jgi:hypothetical protein